MRKAIPVARDGGNLLLGGTVVSKGGLFAVHLLENLVVIGSGKK